MASSYSDVPPGGIVNIPPAITSGMLYRVKQIMGVSKQTLKIVPLSGQLTATNGQKIIFALPPNSLVDLATLEFNFTGATQHRGNNAAQLDVLMSLTAADTQTKMIIVFVPG